MPVKGSEDEDEDEDDSQPQCKKTKTVGLTKKSAALYAHHAFKVYFFGIQLRDYDMKPLNATFYTGREQTTKNFPVSF